MTRAVVVGGGFYGAAIACYLKSRRKVDDVVLLEREPELLGRSSFTNQARVHGGYHYPRSYTTAYRSRVNMPRFRQDFGACVFDRYDSIYAIARRNSKVTVKQMERFCAEIGAPLSPVPDDLANLFDPRLVERAYVTEEEAFNADLLRAIMWGRLREAEVDVRTGAEVARIEEREEDVAVDVGRDGERSKLSATMVFNCTYSRLQRTSEGVASPDFRLRHEIAELVLVEPPPPLADIGVTVMDGAFFSCMPFPARQLHSLTHVRYTPHTSWLDDAEVDPLARLAAYEGSSRADWMIRDAARYMPVMAQARPVTTLFEIKTVLVKSEGDDGRPILFERHGRTGRIMSILGGKIDNIYDILEVLDTERLPQDRNLA